MMKFIRKPRAGTCEKAAACLSYNKAVHTNIRNI